MGFEIFAHCFKNKEPAFYSRQMAEEIFNRGALDPQSPLTCLQYPDGRVEIYGAEEDELNGVMIADFSRTALDRLFELADKTGSLIIWPDPETHLAVTDPAVIAHLPAEFTESGDEIAVVHDVEELIGVIGLVFSNGE
jgi:hypothetical protein